MGRRSLGVLLLTVAALTMMAVGGVRGQRESGHAAPLTFPGPPGVGDCVIEPMPQTMNMVADISNPYLYPQVATAPCVGARYGEVVAVIADPVSTVDSAAGNVGGNAAGVRSTDANMDTCWQAAAAFVGFDISGTAHYGLWSPMMNFRAAASSPSPDQQAAGQHWVACLVDATNFYLGGDGPPATPYPGSLRNAATTGSQRDRVGICAVGTGLDTIDKFVECDAVHNLELFGAGGIGDAALTRSDALLSCRQIVRQATGIDDLAASGSLAVAISVGDSSTGEGSDDTTTALAEDTYLTCGVATTGGARLDGSVQALGALPIPWA